MAPCNTGLDNGYFISRTEGLLLKTMTIVYNRIFNIMIVILRTRTTENTVVYIYPKVYDSTANSLEMLAVLTLHNRKINDKNTCNYTQFYK